MNSSTFSRGALGTTFCHSKVLFGIFLIFFGYQQIFRVPWGSLEFLRIPLGFLRFPRISQCSLESLEFLQDAIGFLGTSSFCLQRQSEYFSSLALYHNCRFYSQYVYELKRQKKHFGLTYMNWDFLSIGKKNRNEFVYNFGMVLHDINFR